jgi:hypothetical protein
LIPSIGGIKVSRRPLLISWSSGSKSLIPTIQGSKLTRSWPIVLILSIERWKCRARHFWSHDLVDLGLWSPPIWHQTKATAAGSECFDPQQ